MQVPNREARVRAVVSLQLVPAPRHCGHVPRVFVVLFILGVVVLRCVLVCVLFARDGGIISW